MRQTEFISTPPGKSLHLGVVLFTIINVADVAQLELITMEDRGPGGPPPRDVHQPASLGATLTSDEPRVSVVVVDNDLHTVRTTGDTEKPDLNGLTPWQTRYQKTDEEMGLSARPTQSPNLYRMGLPLCSFVRLRFPDPDVERDYQREVS